MSDPARQRTAATAPSGNSIKGPSVLRVKASIAATALEGLLGVDFADLAQQQEVDPDIGPVLRWKTARSSPQVRSGSLLIVRDFEGKGRGVAPGMVGDLQQQDTVAAGGAVGALRATWSAGRGAIWFWDHHAGLAWRWPVRRPRKSPGEPGPGPPSGSGAEDCQPSPRQGWRMHRVPRQLEDYECNLHGLFDVGGMPDASGGGSVAPSRDVLAAAHLGKECAAVQVGNHRWGTD
ncbi:uncharacterized protein [Lepisosteus oculatus]|uniref:uncharacterized protein n=1 Tax=Lepisosteus oculatus TaxID=7918 RepID=UPI0035F51E8B